MRPVGLSDLDLAARVLMKHPAGTWAHLSRQMFEAAQRADLWRLRKGQVHPSGGSGSLYAEAALLAPVAAQRQGICYIRALAFIAGAYATWEEGG